MSVKKNLIANFAGSAWSALMGLAFIPLYIRYLGMESYGLIGIFALLQAWFALLDMGLTPTLSREMARFQAGVHSPQEIRDLVCSVERLFGGVAVIIIVGVSLAAPWLSVHWLRVEHLSIDTVRNTLMLIGVVIAMRWLGGLYRSAITGLQRQVWLNACTVVFSTLRGAGVITVLIWVSPTIEAFFIYQGILSALEAWVLATQVRRILPTPPMPARFRWEALLSVWRFAAGMSATAVLVIALTQLDKLLLSKILPLTEFGYYALASTVAGALYMLTGPVSNATYPRLVDLVSRGETQLLSEAYHRYSQMLTMVLVPCALVLSFFSEHLMLLWTHNEATTASVAPLVSLLVLGNMLNGLMHTPYNLQLAFGWTRLAVTLTAISIFFLIPALYFGVSTYGAVAAASIWVVYNILYLMASTLIMHRKLLPLEMWPWCIQDVLFPTLFATIAVFFVRLYSPLPDINHPLTSIFMMSLAGCGALLTMSITTKLGRDYLFTYLKEKVC